MKFIHKSITMVFLVTVTVTSCKNFTSIPAIANPTDVMNAAIPTATTKVAETQTPSVTYSPSHTPQATPTRYQSPTLIPTIESGNIPDLLENSISLETLDAFNGHSLYRITGWSNGFNSGMWDHGASDRYGQGYKWLDSNHVLLFPATGETTSPNWSTIHVRPVVMNIKTGDIWVPPNDRSLNSGRWFSIILPRWSPTLELLVTGEKINDKEGVSTFTVDGKRVAHFEGQLIDIAPSAERIFIKGNTWIDLGNGKTIKFGWEPGWEANSYSERRLLPIWSRDENQIFFCCHYYGNAQTGQSYTVIGYSPNHIYGVWLNDHTVMAQPDWLIYPGTEYIAFFDVIKMEYYNLGTVANLPDAFNNNTYSFKSISPNGDYMYITPGAQSSTDPQIYLVDLKTFESQLYHVSGMSWMANSKYALLHTNLQLANGEYSSETQVLTLSDKTLRTLPSEPSPLSQSDWLASNWYLSEDVSRSIFIKDQYLVVQVLTFEPPARHRYEVLLPPDFNTTYQGYTGGVFRSPKNNHIALIAGDNSVWIMDYPALENLEQLTPPMENQPSISWSPDGRYLSYAGGTDIYIVDIESKP